MTSLKETAVKMISKVSSYIGKPGRWSPLHDDDFETCLEMGLSKTAILLNWYIKKELSKDYNDYGHFTVTGIAKALKTSTSTIRESLEECEAANLLWVYSLSQNKGKIIFLAKKENISIFEGIKSGNIPVEKFTEHRVKISYQTVKNFLSNGEKFTSIREENHQYNNLKTIVNTDNTATLLEPSLEPLLRTSSSEQKEISTTENLLETKTLHDDDLFNKFSNEETTELVVNEDFNNSDSKDTFKHKDSLLRANEAVGAGQKENIPPARPADCGQNVDDSFIKHASNALKALYKKFRFDKKTYDLLVLFEAAKNSDNQNINFNLETALDLINMYPEKVIRSQLEYLPHRYDGAGKAIGSGYLIRLIKSHSMEAPAGYTDKIKIQKEKKEIELYTKIVSIWGYSDRIGDIRVVYKFVNEKVDKLFNSGKLEEIKEKIKETAKLINPLEIIKRDYLEMVGSY